MGNAGSAILWNSVPYSETSQFRRQPTWAYYSQVSITSPHWGQDAGVVADVYTTRGSLPSPDDEPDTQSTALAIGHSGGPPLRLVAGGTRREENRQSGPWTLTQRELEVLQLLTEGSTNCEISQRLCISQKTTKNHLAAIFQKLDVTNRTQALVRAVVMGLVSIE
jgi:DNA-binding CsgD family transcriptional regulator